MRRAFDDLVADRQIDQRIALLVIHPEDVRVLEDGVQQQLFTFQQETDRPLSIAFLIDVSISQQRTLADEKAAAVGRPRGVHPAVRGEVFPIARRDRDVRRASQIGRAHV